MNRFLLLLSFIALLIGCTDIPISNNRKVTEKRILGLWKLDESTYVKISEDEEKNGVLNFLTANLKSDILNNSDTTIYKLFFIDFDSSNSFLSIEITDKENKKEYETYKYSFDSKENLILESVNVGYLKKNNQKNENFETIENFQKLLKANLKNSNIYEEKKILTKKIEYYSFEKTEIQIKKNIPQKYIVDIDNEGIIPSLNNLLYLTQLYKNGQPKIAHLLQSKSYSLFPGIKEIYTLESKVYNTVAFTKYSNGMIYIDLVYPNGCSYNLEDELKKIFSDDLFEKKANTESFGANMGFFSIGAKFIKTENSKRKTISFFFNAH